MCCVYFASALFLYVRQCTGNTTPNSWWLLCLQWSVLQLHSRGGAVVQVDRPKSLSDYVMLDVMRVHLHVLSSLSRIHTTVQKQSGETL